MDGTLSVGDHNVKTLARPVKRSVRLVRLVKRSVRLVKYRIKLVTFISR